MERRRLGESTLTVAPWCFGGNVFGWTADEATSFALLDAFLDEGFDFIDTADVYSRWVPGHEGGESERIIGAWMRARDNRSRVVLATKVGSDMGSGKVDLSKHYIVEAVEASLRRLQTDHIDLYQSHRDDPATPLDETLEAYAALIKAGKVRAIGASNFTLDRLRASVETSRTEGWPSYQTLQPQYNLYDRAEFENEVQAFCVEQKIGVIPYYALAAGFLTGKYRSEADFAKSTRGGGMGAYLNDRGRRILAALDQVAAQHAATPAQVALAWLMAQPAIAAPIASATSLDQLRTLAQAIRLALSAEDFRVLDKASRPDD